ncbi:MAG TPA: phytoene/squalene synthase family protein [Pseudobdellovibrionaceae bacterium]|nr:phytoene/squalene synthase family protein [Pseudobdellovibrionaceae bacterium]
MTPKSLESHRAKADRFRRGSRTFSFAALFFNRRQLQATREFYSFCRIVDDAIDEAPSAEIARHRAEVLLHALDRNETTTDERLSVALESWYALEAQFQIPRSYARELILGQLMDAQGFRPATREELDLYCYRVAGVVGLAMCHITGILRSSAKPCAHPQQFQKSEFEVLSMAAACGRALQLTNIARDLFEDHRRGRSYFPQELSPQINTSFDPDLAHQQARQLLNWADESYAVARQGWWSLPFRPRLAVAIAQSLYREIGQQVLRGGPTATLRRQIVPRHRQITLAIGLSFKLVVLEMWSRLSRPAQLKLQIVRPTSILGFAAQTSNQRMTP